jgi:hypothetical protein
VKNILLGILLAIAAFSSYHAYKWKRIADERGYYAEVAYAWLSQPLAKSGDGTPLTRAAILDAVAKASLNNGNTQDAAGQGAPAAGRSGVHDLQRHR